MEAILGASQGCLRSILTRRPGESLFFELPNGKRIQVSVLDVKGKQVRIGTDASDEVVILRKELQAS